MSHLQLGFYQYYQAWRQLLRAYFVGVVTEQEHTEEIEDLRIIYGISRTTHERIPKIVNFTQSLSMNSRYEQLVSD